MKASIFMKLSKNSISNGTVTTNVHIPLVICSTPAALPSAWASLFLQWYPSSQQQLSPVGTFPFLKVCYARAWLLTAELQVSRQPCGSSQWLLLPLGSLDSSSSPWRGVGDAAVHGAVWSTAAPLAHSLSPSASYRFASVY